MPRRPIRAWAPFDGIASSLVLFFLPDPSRPCARGCPWCVQEERVGVTTFGETDPRWRDVDAVLQPYLPKRDARTSGSQGPFGSDAGMEQLLLDGGFISARTVSQRIDVVFSGFDQWLAFSMSTGQRAAWLAVPEADLATAREEVATRLLSHARPDGSISFEQVVRHTLAERE